MELTQEFFAEQLKQLATKEDLKDFTTKDDLLELATKQDLHSLKSSLDDIQAKVTRIDKRTGDDARAALKDIQNLQQRVRVLEQQLKLQPNN